VVETCDLSGKISRPHSIVLKPPGFGWRLLAIRKEAKELSQTSVLVAETPAAARRSTSRPLTPRFATVICLIFFPGWVSAQSAAVQVSFATIRGTVTDPSGSVVASAIVSLEPAASAAQRTTITDDAGS